MCVVPLTDCTLDSKYWYLRLWIVDGSHEAESWTQMDRQTENQDTKGWGTVSFAVSNAAECRFVRITQAYENHSGNDALFVIRVESFVAVSE
jgi:hypothetical protein